MSQNTQHLIGIKDVAARLPNFLAKVPHLVQGLTQAYLRTPKMSAGLGIAFEKAVKRNPTGMALLYEDQKFTYTALNEWANQIGHYYLSLGAKKGDVVAVMLENRPEYIAAVIGLAKIGVTIALLNSSQVGKVLAHSINLVKPIAILAGEECANAVQAIRDELSLPNDRYHWFADTITQQDAGHAPQDWQNLATLIRTFPTFNTPTTKSVVGQDGLFYIYTSGTTGLPKAVVFRHSRWMLAYGTYGHVLNLNSKDVMYCTLPLYHATGMVVCWCGVLAGAATFAIRRKFSTSSFWKDVQKFDASAIGYVGELCRYLMDAPPSELEKSHRVTKMIGNGMRPNIWDKFKTRFAVQEVLELYGSSEGNVGFSNIFNFDNTVGYSPTPYAIVQFDKDSNAPVRDKNGHCIKVKKGEVGLLIGKITRRAPFDGYTDPEKNKAVMMKDVFTQGDSYFNTGDLVRDIGFRHAQFVDRLGDTFRWKGENVSTTEVENMLTEYHKILEAVVYGVEIPNTNGRAGMAAITLQTGSELNGDDLKDMVSTFKQHLPHYAVPVFLRIQQHVETTGTFKYQKNKLKEHAFDPVLCQERVLVLLPGQDAYCDVSPEIFASIQAGEYRF